jgi:flagellar hook-associated protein 3 FlgL
MTGLAGGGLLAQLVADSAAARQQVDTLTRQASSGQVADTYGGLGRLARVSLDLRPQIAQAQAWTTNIDAAGTRLDATQSVLKQLGDIASSFAADALGPAMSSMDAANALAVQANAALSQVTSLLNTQVGGAYILSGTDSANAPVDPTALAGFIGGVQTQVSAMPANGVSATVTNVQNVAVTGSIVSATIGTTPVATEIGPGWTVPEGVVASQNLAQPATRSYVKDLVASLAALAGLSNVSMDQTTRSSFAAAMSNMLNSAATAATNDQAVLGQVQSELTTRQTGLEDTVATIKKQVSSVEEVDMAATATALSQVQAQLQASYKLIAGMRDLSLASYL